MWETNKGTQKLITSWILQVIAARSGSTSCWIMECIFSQDCTQHGENLVIYVTVGPNNKIHLSHKLLDLDWIKCLKFCLRMISDCDVTAQNISISNNLSEAVSVFLCVILEKVNFRRSPELILSTLSNNDACKQLKNGKRGQQQALLWKTWAKSTNQQLLY